MKQAIILFSRIPVAGRTKTRMMPFLTGEECSKLHKSIIMDIYESCLKTDADILVSYAPEGDVNILKGLLGEEHFYFSQQGESLGERMKHAFDEAFKEGYKEVLLIGTDIPQVTDEILTETFEGLSEHDIVINPTVDGGYYLIAMKEPHDVIWQVERYGTNTVLQDTLLQIQKCGLIVKTGAVCRDIDTEEDLKILYKELKTSDENITKHTMAFLEQYLKERLECIHCGLCIKKCSFLTKYDMDLSMFARSPELAYSCFMCRKCTSVCPKKLSGEKIALRMRIEEVEKGKGIVKDSSYKGLLWEKNRYKFANYRKSKHKSVLMPGCNFPSFFPETMKYLENLMHKHDIGMLYECCGKPVYELGLITDAKESLQRIERKLKENGVEELILLCPNCYSFMKDKLQIPIVSIYSKLKELGEGSVVEREEFPIYYPCPDRKDKVLFEEIKHFLRGEITEPFERVQCCGLGGCAMAKEPKLSKAMVETVVESGEDKLYTYCASCISNYQRNGFSNANHLLPLILGIDEKFPLGIRPFLNRAKHKIL